MLIMREDREVAIFYVEDLAALANCTSIIIKYQKASRMMNAHGQTPERLVCLHAYLTE
jgi:hypothetical protein